MNALSGFAPLLFLLAGKPPPRDSGDPPKIVAVLCDPASSRLSVRTGAEAQIPGSRYAVRWFMNVDDLIVHFSGDGGNGHYQAGLLQLAICGRFVIELSGDFLNPNLDGEMGAIDPFAALSVTVYNPTTVNNLRLYPAGTRRWAIRLAPCDRDPHSRWGDCPEGWAVRVDLAYRPKTEKLLVHEWVVSGDVIGGVLRHSERLSTVRAPLRLWRHKHRRLNQH